MGCCVKSEKVKRTRHRRQSSDTQNHSGRQAAVAIRWSSIWQFRRTHAPAPERKTSKSAPCDLYRLHTSTTRSTSHKSGSRTPSSDVDPKASGAVTQLDSQQRILQQEPFGPYAGPTFTPGLRRRRGRSPCTPQPPSPQPWVCAPPRWPRRGSERARASRCRSAFGCGSAPSSGPRRARRSGS